MIKAIPVLVALFTASTGRGQLAWVMDTTFRTDIEWRGVSDIEFRPNGTWISGEFKYLNDVNFPRYSAVLDENGARITTFQNTAGGGMIRPWGADRFYVGNGQGVVRRSFIDGSVDHSFDMENAFAASVHGGDFHVYPNGKVLVSGSRDLWSLADTSFMGPQFCLVRLDTNGLPDPTFQHRQCLSGIVRKIWPLPDGKFLLAGVQNIYDGQPVGHVLRVHPDGSIDTTFHTTIDYGYATDHYLYPDGRLLLTGWFRTPELAGDTVELIRLLPDGTVDQSFNYALDFRHVLGANVPAVTQGLYQLDPSTFLICGDYSQVNGEWVGGILAVDTAGNILQDYFPGMGCDSLISLPNILSLGLRDIEQAPDGSLYAYGNFHGFDDGYINDPEQRMIIKLKQVEVGVEENEKEKENEENPDPANVSPNPGTDEVRVEWPGHSIEFWELRTLEGRRMRSGAGTSVPLRIDVKDLAAGIYLLRIVDASGLRTTLRAIKP